MPSASRHLSLLRRPLTRAAVVAACLALVTASVSGCETTQEKAAKQQARSAHILRERAKRQQAKKARKAHRHSQRHHEEKTK